MLSICANSPDFSSYLDRLTLDFYAQDNVCRQSHELSRYTKQKKVEKKTYIYKLRIFLCPFWIWSRHYAQVCWLNEASRSGTNNRRVGEMSVSPSSLFAKLKSCHFLSLDRQLPSFRGWFCQVQIFLSIILHIRSSSTRFVEIKRRNVFVLWSRFRVVRVCEKQNGQTLMKGFMMRKTKCSSFYKKISLPPWCHRVHVLFEAFLQFFTAPNVCVGKGSKLSGGKEMSIRGGKNCGDNLGKADFQQEISEQSIWPCLNIESSVC